MRAASQVGLPALRALFLEFPRDPACYQVEDAFMLGSDLLVAPVLEYGARSRRVYLPPGQWRHAWTGDLHPGGQWLEVPAPLEQIPVFIRAESALSL